MERYSRDSIPRGARLLTVVVYVYLFCLFTTDKLTISFSRSRGPGGQNVNKREPSHPHTHPHTLTPSHPHTNHCALFPSEHQGRAAVPLELCRLDLRESQGEGEDNVPQQAEQGGRAAGGLSEASLTAA